MALGKSAYIPFLVDVLLIMYCRLFENQRIISIALQAVLPVVAAWWCIICFYNLVEEDGNEVFFSYPINRWWIGIGRCLSFYMLYIITIYIIILLCGVDIVIIKSVFIQLIIQSFFYVSLGFMLVLITTNTGVSIGLVIGYCTFQLLSQGKVLSFINIYNFGSQPQTIETGIYIVLLSLVFLVIGQFLILKRFKFM